ncbi:ladderlectin-like isoform X2 [Colossoma macropomum]|uniref:ladderlectin-like isoform X2 n=1 Tax=Colossoma macropomum TaxID=42526 RepID=UPI00186489EA|nr:ladderlectin-like isoform X2 [Colossoma macropomum]
MNTLVLLCLFCVSFSYGAPVDEAVESINDQQPDPAPATFVQCPAGWFRHGSRCFLLVKSRMSWLNAENHCVSQQGSLASVQSPAEYQFLQNLADLGGQTSAWIGAFNFQNTWMWIDRAGFYYSNWQSLSSVSSNPCAYLQARAGWANTNCATTLGFFCVRIPQC